MCCKAEENIKHIFAGCTELVPFRYTNRHNEVAGYIHWKICKHMGLQVTENYNEHIPERVINIKSTTIMWDVLVIKEGTVLATLPDVTVHDDTEKTCLLIDIALPGDSNFNTKESEKLNKYKELEIEVSRMWHKWGQKLCQLYLEHWKQLRSD